jgi:hypothetical protein
MEKVKMFGVFIDDQPWPIGFSSSYAFCETMGKRFASHTFEIKPVFANYELIPLDKIMEPG